MSDTLLSRFPGTPVLVVGDVMLDAFIWGQVSRISPEAPVPVVEVRERSFTAGGAANTAAAIAALQGKAYLAGIVGHDNEAAQLQSMLHEQGIDTSAMVVDESRSTITKTRIVAHNQQVVRIDLESHDPVAESVSDRLLQQIETKLGTVRCCILSDYGKGVATERFTRKLIAMARDNGVSVIVDPKGLNYTKYRGATLVKPNQLEAAQVLGREFRSDADVQRAGHDLREQLGETTSVLITRGPQGMSLFEQGREPVHIPTQAREVFDVTGAGDTVAGTIGMTLAVGGDLTTACEWASRAAAVVVGKLGTATCTLAELQHQPEGQLAAARKNFSRN